MTDEETAATEARLTAKRKVAPIKSSDLLSSGSVLLNLASTGLPGGCYEKSSYHFLVGDSKSGKTLLALTALAEAKKSHHFEGYKLIFDGPENGAYMLHTLFPILEDCWEPPKGTREDPIYSTTVEDFHANAKRLMKAGPCVYVLDSMDALWAEAEEIKADKQAKAAEDGKTEKGSYGVDKAKINAYRMRTTFNACKVNHSVLILIAQTSDKIGFGVMPGQKTRAGGTKLTFYASFEAWTSIRQHLFRTYKGKDLEVGINLRCRVTKNRFNGRPREALLTIYHDSGLSDIDSCVNFLIEWKHWKTQGGEGNGRGKKKQGVIAPEFDFSGDCEELVQKIDGDAKLKRQLRQIVTETWQEIEAAVTVPRQPRYQ